MIDDPLPPGQRQRLRIVGAALVAGAFAFLAVTAFLGSRMAPTGLAALGYVGAGLALLSPILARWLRGRAIQQAEGIPGRAPLAAFQGRLLQLALLEAATMVCGVTALMSGASWPLLAAAVPLAVMLREVTAAE
jgi:hypothetical protein